ncbi:MAG: hypothetical protein OXI22_07185 [Defluviicoccus sp.]|nr:hypothetical protein [Defluviicoccus sp.]MDE0383648.1 hypothetical protein [Defluviicoccus sp.]
MPGPKPTVVVHGLDHALAAARAAAALGTAVRLRSGPAAAGYAGAAWFAEIVRAARRAHPEVTIDAVLDCGDSPGMVLAALRRSVEAVRFDGSPAVRGKLEALARAAGARIEADVAPALDLAGEGDPESACRSWFAAAAERAPR